MPRLHPNLVAAAVAQARVAGREEVSHHVGASLGGSTAPESFQHRKAFESARARAALVRHLLHETTDGGYLLIAVGGVHSRHCRDLEAVNEILNRMGAPA